MSSIANDRSGYREWCVSAGFPQQGPVYKAIKKGRRRFNSATDNHTQSLTRRIASWVVTALVIPNAMVEEWPEPTRRKLNDSSCPPRAGNSPAFETWARERDLEKRKQAISVWSSLLVFLVFHWHDYGADHALEAMGLHLSPRLKDCIDTIRIYAELYRGYRNAYAEAVKDFFTLVIMDTEATPTTNPLSWWLVVLIQTEVLDDQPRWEVEEGVRDTLDFAGKLEAIDHYARVLILDHAYYAWMHDTSPGSASRADKEKVTESLDAAAMHWVDRDEERPRFGPYVEDYNITGSREWTLCSSYIHPILALWLTDQSRGPMRDIIKLRRSDPVLFTQRKRYQVKFEIHEHFTMDPCIAVCYPALVATESTVEKANEAARNAFIDDFGEKEDAHMWHEVYENGKIRIRAVYQDFANNAKAIAWVEEESVDESTIEAGNKSIKGNKRTREKRNEQEKVTKRRRRPYDLLGLHWPGEDVERDGVS